MKLLLLFIFPLCFHAGLYAQESDRKLNPDKIPASVISFINEKYPDHERIHFYKEMVNDTLYYETAFEQKEDKFNLLFDTNGNLYETEKTLPLQALNTEIKTTIEKYLSTEFEKYKIVKVEEVELKEQFMYELNVKGKKKGKVSFYEIYFDRAGNFLGEEDIVLKSIPSMF